MSTSPQLLRRLALVLVLTLAGLLMVAGPASAHASLISSDPIQGSVVATAPKTVVLTFDESVSTTPDSIRVLDPDGARVDDGTAHTGTRGSILIQTLKANLANGTYTVAWHVVSADSHPVQGAFTFSIGAAGSTSVDPTTLTSSGSAIVGVTYDVVRWLSYTSFALLVGGGFVLARCWPQGTGRKGPRTTVRAAALGLALAALAGYLLQGVYAAQLGLDQGFSLPLLRSTGETPIGVGDLVRALLALLAVLVPLPPRGTTSRWGRALGQVVWLAIGAALSCTWALTDHAHVGSETGLAITSDILHLTTMALWVGGLALLSGAALRSQAPGGANAATRFSPVAFTSVCVLVATGMFQAWRNVGSFAALWGTDYGRLVVAKASAVVALVVVAAFTRRTLRRRLLAEPLPGQPSLVRLRRFVALELALAVAVLAVSAVLVNTATARESYEQPVNLLRSYDTGGPGGRGTLDIFLTPAHPGPDTLHLYLSDASGVPAAPAQVTASFSLPAEGIQRMTAVLTHDGPGHYSGSVTLPFSGQWTVTVVVRSDALNETEVTATIPVTG